MVTKYVIEKRHPSGNLDFSDPQAHDVFGMSAIKGITEDEIAKVVFKRLPDATLDGMGLLGWAAKVDPKFVTRVKYW